MLRASEAEAIESMIPANTGSTKATQNFYLKIAKIYSTKLTYSGLKNYCFN